MIVVTMFMSQYQDINMPVILNKEITPNQDMISTGYDHKQYIPNMLCILRLGMIIYIFRTFHVNLTKSKLTQNGLNLIVPKLTQEVLTLTESKLTLEVLKFSESKLTLELINLSKSKLTLEVLNLSQSKLTL